MSRIAYGALWLFVLAVPWERIIALPGLYIITRATGALALLLSLLAIVVSGRFRRWRGFHTAALLFVAWTGLGVWIIGMPKVPNKLYTFVQLFSVVWMMWELTTTRRRQLGLLLAYVLGAYIASFATLILYRNEAALLRRFAAGGADPNSLAMTLSLALPMAWYLGMRSERPLVRWLGRAYMPIGVLSVALTGSRGGMLACLVALMIVPLTMTLSPGRLATTVCMLVLSGALAIAYVPDKIVQRLATTGTEVQDARFGGRFKLWVAGFRAFADKPVMGYGVSSFKQTITPQLGSAAQVAHDSFLSVAVEEGLVGLVFYLWMLLAVFLSLLRLPRIERRFALVLFAVLVTALLPLTWEDQKDAWVVMAILVGMGPLWAYGTGGSRAEGGASRLATVETVPPARPGRVGALRKDAGR
jgi:O-antigen ligase